ncbi:MAG: hypothetical protein DMD48_02225 [Gemmatimonadetes bacterium]|nr:MAG: hypothetical protein DMD48_02225 [Gemmatimonadota bacterium]
MGDRSELALQLTDAVIAARQAIERAGNRAYKAFGLSQRAHAVMQAVDLGGPDGARPSDVASGLGVSLTRHGLEVLLRVGQLERRLAARTIEGMPASAMARTIQVLQELKSRLAQKSLEVVR